jgi:hypothetical protein
MILFSVPHGAAAGNMVRSGIIGRVLKSQPSLDVVILSPMAADAAFVKEVAHPRVTIDTLPPHRPSGLEARLLALMQAGYLESGVTESVRIRRVEAQAKGTIRWIGLKHLIARMALPSLVKKEARYDAIDRRVSHPQAEQVFDRYRPELLVTSSPGLILSEVPLLRTAKRHGVRTMAIDPSWDNFTNKLMPVRRVNRLVVWNDLMKTQAVELHGYRADEVRVAGVPQWDRYFSHGATGDRATFFRRIGADPSRRLITLTTTPQELYSHHDHVLRAMTGAMRDGRWPPAQILVRLHPRDDRAKYTQFEGAPGIIIEKPFRDTVRAGDGLSVDVTSDSQQHLADTLRHSDVIVNVASTIAVEAAIFDTPVVNVAFDGEVEQEFARSARRYYQFTHYANITRHQAVRVAWSPDELIDYVRAYLADPAQDRAGREHVVREQCQFTDGRAAERVAGFVIAEWRGRNNQSCAASPALSR